MLELTDTLLQQPDIGNNRDEGCLNLNIHHTIPRTRLIEFIDHGRNTFGTKFNVKEFWYQWLRKDPIFSIVIGTFDSRATPNVGVMIQHLPSLGASLSSALDSLVFIFAYRHELHLEETDLLQLNLKNHCATLIHELLENLNQVDSATTTTTIESPQHFALQLCCLWCGVAIESGSRRNDTNGSDVSLLGKSVWELIHKLLEFPLNAKSVELLCGSCIVKEDGFSSVYDSLLYRVLLTGVKVNTPVEEKCDQIAQSVSGSTSTYF